MGNWDKENDFVFSQFDDTDDMFSVATHDGLHIGTLTFVFRDIWVDFAGETHIVDTFPQAIEALRKSAMIERKLAYQQGDSRGAIYDNEGRQV